MTYNPKIQNLDNTVTISGNILVDKQNTTISATNISVTSIKSDNSVLANNTNINTIDYNIIKNLRTVVANTTSDVVIDSSSAGVILANPITNKINIELPYVVSASGRQYAIKKINSTDKNIDIFPKNRYYPAIYSGTIIPIGDYTRITGSEGFGNLGSSLDISGDDSIIIAGDSEYRIPVITSSTEPPQQYFRPIGGGIHVYRTSSNGYVKECVLTAIDQPNIYVESLGGNVAISYDGKLIAATAQSTDPPLAPAVNAGVVVLYRTSSIGWNIEAFLTSSGNLADPNPVSDQLGSSIAMNKSGNVIAVGMIEADTPSSSAGSVVVYRSSSFGWIQEAFLTSSGDGTPTNDDLGADVAINNNGDLIFAGYPGYDLPTSTDGGIVVYRSSSIGWAQEIILTASSGSSISMANRVVCNGSGNIVVASCPTNTIAGGFVFAGTAFVFSSSSIGWRQEIMLTASLKLTSSNFGSDVSINEDGNKIMIGTPDYFTSSLDGIGGLHFFDSSSIGWRQRQFLTSAYNISNSLSFGSVVKLNRSGNFAASYTAIYNVPAKSMSAFSILNSSSTGAGWRETQLFTSSIYETLLIENDGFGASVAINDTADTILAGSSRYSIPSRTDLFNNGPGAIIVLKSSSIGWYEQTVITSSNTGAASIGYCLSTNSAMNIIATGTPNSLNGSGSVYIFRSSSIGWREEKILTSSTQIGRANNLGYEVFMNEAGNQLAVGSLYYSSSLADSVGGIVIFNSSSEATGWREKYTLTGPVPSPLAPTRGFGLGFSMTDDGRYIFQPTYDYSSSLYGAGHGAGFIYQSSSVGWRLVQTLEPLINNGNITGQICGYNGIISHSGNLIAIDAWDTNTRDYGIFIYRTSSNGYQLESTITSSLGDGKNLFLWHWDKLVFNKLENKLLIAQRGSDSEADYALGSYNATSRAFHTIYSSSKGWVLGSTTSPIIEAAGQSLGAFSIETSNNTISTDYSGNITIVGSPYDWYVSGGIYVYEKGRIYVFNSVETIPETIDGLEVKTLSAAQESVTLISDGTGSWRII